MEKVREFFKKMTYGHKALILLIVSAIFTFITPINNRTALIRVALVIAFLYYLVRWICSKIFSKHNKTDDQTKELKEKKDGSRDKLEKATEKCVKKVEEEADSPTKETEGRGNKFKDIILQIAHFISSIKDPVWAIVFLVLAILFSVLGDKIDKATQGRLCFISRLLFSIFSIRALLKRSKNQILEAKKSEKMAHEIAESIKNGTYPEVEVDIPLDKDEKAYGVYAVALIKEKTVRSTTSYGGPTASIKIMKGVRYRVGNISHQTESYKTPYAYDYGTLYVTTKKFIYVGDKETDTIKAKEMLQLKVEGNYIIIYKNKGKAIKYQFTGNHDTFIGVMQGLNKAGDVDQNIEKEVPE